MNVRSLSLGSLLVVTILGSARVADAKPTDAPTTATNADRERSRSAFRRGVAQLRAQDWAAARASFEEAWGLVQHPSILLNLGIARLKTDEPVLAEEDLVRFLSEDPGAAPEELASAREALAEARARIGTLRVTFSPPSARIVVDGKPAPTRAAERGEGEGLSEVRTKAGPHTVAASADGFAASSMPVEIAPKSVSELRIALVRTAGETAASAPPSDRGPSTRTILGWSLAGFGGVALVTSGIMGLRAMSLASDYEDRQNRATFQNADVKSEGITFRTAADVFLLTALVAGAGAALLLLTDLGASDSPRKTSAPRPYFVW